MPNRYLKLYHIGLLRPKGIAAFVQAQAQHGFNLMTLLAYAAKMFPQRLALSDGEHAYTYAQLEQESLQLAAYLQGLGIQKKQNLGIWCRSHTGAVLALFASARLGAHVYLLNAEMSAEQLAKLCQQRQLKHIIYDQNLASTLEQANVVAKVHSIEDLRLDMQAATPSNKLSRCYGNHVVVLTGGTTGDFKSAARKPSIAQFLNPFLDLLHKLNLNQYSKVFIPTPIYHGYGLSALFISFILGARVYLSPKFEAEKACQLIQAEQVEVLALVPLMLHKMLAINPEALRSARCIISGGAALNPSLVEASMQQLGPVLHNLYGTTEAGFSIMAMPQDLATNPNTIGRPITGVRVKMEPLGHSANMGHLCIANRWAVSLSGKAYVPTGDIAYTDAQGLYYLQGRVDDMIVSGGENVYPIELELALLQHPGLDAVAVIGIADPIFGQRLKAYVQPKPGFEALTEQALLDWLQGKVARYQMPKQIELRAQLPYTAIGKLDKKQLRG